MPEAIRCRLHLERVGTRDELTQSMAVRCNVQRENIRHVWVSPETLQSGLK
jgi:hypothetical protein